MNKIELIKKLEDAVNSLKQEIDRNDGSTLAAIGNNIGSCIDGIVDEISNSKKAQRLGDSIKKHWSGLEEAIVKGDRKISASALSVVQKGIHELKKKLGEEIDAPTFEYKGKPFAQSEPNRSTVFKAGKGQEAPVAKPKKKGEKTAAYFGGNDSKTGDEPTIIVPAGETPNESKVFKVGRNQEVPIAKPEKKTEN